MHDIEEAVGAQGGWGEFETTYREDWSSAFDGENPNASGYCKDGTFINTIIRSGGLGDDWLYNIEGAECARPTGAKRSYQDCYAVNKEEGMNDRGKWLRCKNPGDFIMGFHAQGCKGIDCLGIQCCKLSYN